MIILFYGRQEYGRYIAFKEMHKDLPNEVYQGGYVYMMTPREWYRCDTTPCLIEDVPKILRTLVLIMNL
jgi:hypothetical protein